MRLKLVCCASLIFLTVACNKKGNDATPSASPQPTPAAAPAPAPTAAPTPASADASGATAETTAKMAAAEWAIKQDEIKNDPNG